MEVKKLHGMGNHLIIDAYGCNRKHIDNMEIIRIFLKELAQKIDMKIIDGPKVIKHEADNKEERGVTGFTILAESHISIHTYPEKGFFSLDIFTCKEFDMENAKNFVKRTFSVKKLKDFLIKREYETS